MPSIWIMLGASDDSFSQLAYVIAVLVLAGLGALADKIKKRHEEPPRGRPGQRPERDADEALPDPEEWREILLPPTESKPPRPVPPPPQRPPLQRAPSVPPRQPMPARRPTKARPAVLVEAESARADELGEYVASRKVGSEVGQLRKAMPAPGAGRQMITKMGSDSVVSSVATAAPGMVAIATPVATVVGPAGNMSVSDLRRAFVMSEVFQPPLALRN